MKVAMDRVGRVVIPKAIRDSMGLGPDVELEVVSDGTTVSLRPIAPRERPVGTSDGLPILGHVPGSVITDDDVRKLRDELQR